MQALRKAWQALEIIGAARDLAIDTRRFSWDAAAGTTFYLQAEQADIRLTTHERGKIFAKIELRASFGWQLVTDRDEAGVYIIARRKPLIGSVGRARFDITLPADLQVSLKLEHCQVCLVNVNAELDLPPFS